MIQPGLGKRQDRIVPALVQMFQIRSFYSVAYWTLARMTAFIVYTHPATVAPLGLIRFGCL